MIVVRLSGGLGNQLFQYAAARSLAIRHGTELVLDLDWYARTPVSDTPRKFELESYCVAGRHMTEKEDRFAGVHRGRVLRRLPWHPGPWKHVREQDANFDIRMMATPDNAYLDGYWQSPLYFKDIESTLRRELVVRNAPSQQDMQMLNAMSESRSVALHVRRGDYVTHPSAIQTHGASEVGYYIRAMQKISGLISEPHFFVFSDDIPWAREKLPFSGDVTFVVHNGPDRAVQDLYLMSSCDHQIIANSSFSWWAAWLNPNPNKIIVAPSCWYADGRAMPTLIPDSWVRL